MYRLLFTLTGIFIFLISYSQTVEGLKKGSDQHSKNSGNKPGSGNQNAGKGSGTYSSGNASIDPGCMIDGCSILFDIFSNIEERDEPVREYDYNRPDYPEGNMPRGYDQRPGWETPPDADTFKTIPPPETPKLLHPPITHGIDSGIEHEKQKEDLKPKGSFEKVSIGIRGSFYPANYRIWVPELSGGKGFFSYSARVLLLSEQRLDKVDHYSTFDFQPLQINFYNTRACQFKIGIGGMNETYSGKTYFELTSNLKVRVGKKVDMGIEGRIAVNNGIVRREGSMNLNYAIWQKASKQFLVGLNGMISQYYQTVNINVVSFSTGFRF